MIFDKAQFVQLMTKLIVSPYEMYEILPSEQGEVTIYMRSGEIVQDGVQLSVAANLHFADYLLADDSPGPVLADIEVAYWSATWRGWVRCHGLEEATEDDVLLADKLAELTGVALERAKKMEAGE